MNFEMVLKNS